MFHVKHLKGGKTMRIIDLLSVAKDRDCTFIISYRRTFVGFFTMGELILNDSLTSKEIRTLKARTHNLRTTYIIDCFDKEG